MDRRYESEAEDDRRILVGLRLIMLYNLIPPEGYTGSVSQLRKAILADPEIDWTIRHLVRLKKLELLDRCDILELASRRNDRIKAIARNLERDRQRKTKPYG